MDLVQRYYEHFDEWSRLDSPEGRLEFSGATRLLAHTLPVGAAVLDLGGGPGRYSMWLAARGHPTTLVDPVPRLVAEAGERARAAGLDLRTELGDARDLTQIADASFDAVIAFGPFYHLTDPGDRARAIHEIARVLRPGGVAYILYVPRLSGLRGLIVRAESRPDQVDVEALRRCARDGVFLNRSSDGFPAAWYPMREEVLALARAGALTVEREVSLKGFAAGQGEVLARLASSHPEFALAAQDLASELGGVAEALALGDQVVVVARR